MEMVPVAHIMTKNSALLSRKTGNTIIHRNWIEYDEESCLCNEE